jgi:hypothetical protein
VYVHIAILDADDNVWWEMPDDMTERLMSADTTHDFAVIAQAIRGALRTTDEQAGQNVNAGSTDS